MPVGAGLKAYLSVGETVASWWIPGIPCDNEDERRLDRHRCSEAILPRSFIFATPQAVGSLRAFGLFGLSEHWKGHGWCSWMKGTREARARSGVQSRICGEGSRTRNQPGTLGLSATPAMTRANLPLQWSAIFSESRRRHGASNGTFQYTRPLWHARLGNVSGMKFGGYIAKWISIVRQR
jgi:hypothetical protein